jgi:hypothetical protein
MAQALHLANGATLNEKLRADTGAVARLASGGASDAEILETLFLSALSRPPTDSERSGMLPLLAEASSGLDGDEAAQARRQAVEDLYWAVMTSNEFLFNH